MLVIDFNKEELREEKDWIVIVQIRLKHKTFLSDLKLTNKMKFRVRKTTFRTILQLDCKNTQKIIMKNVT